MMKQMVVTYDTEVLHTIKSFSNANNHELFSCAPPPMWNPGSASALPYNPFPSLFGNYPTRGADLYNGTSLKVSLHIRGLLRVFTPPETLHENALFALIDL